MLSKTILKKLFSLSLLLALLLPLASCVTAGKIDPLDREANLTRDDWQKTLLKTPPSRNLERAKDGWGKNAADQDMPAISSLITSPNAPLIGGDKVISLTVTEDVPLKDVLIELGRLAKIDVDLEANITGGIILSAKNRPLKEVIDRIASLAHLGYSYKNGVLRFKADAPYMKNYFVDYLTEGSTVWADVEANLPIIAQNASSAVASGAEGGGGASAMTTSINKSAGIISAFASDTQHKAIAAYLDDVNKYASSQVLIEAKIVEVTLSKEFQAGINWSLLDAHPLNIKFNNASDIPGNTFSITSDGTNPVGLKLFGNNITAAVKALEAFGTSRGVSSPRLHAMNNQKASLDFSENLIYFTLTTSQSTTTGQVGAPVTASNVTATKTELPIGVKIDITPSINLKTREVTLNISPTISVDSGERVTDPSVNPATGASLNNKIPIIKTRKVTTLAKVQSGEVLVIGGLLQETGDNNESGVPFLSKIPILGYLFKYTSKKSKLIETVIFIKATIIDSGAPMEKYDRDFVDKFTTNKRKF